jgi:hypothetical protein
LLLKGDLCDVLHQFFAHMLDQRGQDVAFQGGGLGVVVRPFISNCTLIQPVASIPNIAQINAALGNAKLWRPHGADDGVARALGLDELLQQATVLAAIEEETMEASAVEILDAGIVVVGNAARAGTERRRTSTRGTCPPDVTGGRRGRRGGRGGGGGCWWCWKW